MRFTMRQSYNMAVYNARLRLPELSFSVPPQAAREVEWAGRYWSEYQIAQSCQMTYAGDPFDNIRVWLCGGGGGGGRTNTNDTYNPRCAQGGCGAYSYEFSGIDSSWDIYVGGGGAGKAGSGGYNNADAMYAGDGAAGQASRITRLTDGALIAQATGGEGGAATGNAAGAQRGARPFSDAANFPALFCEGGAKGGAEVSYTNSTPPAAGASATQVGCGGAGGAIKGYRYDDGGYTQESRYYSDGGGGYRGLVVIRVPIRLV